MKKGGREWDRTIKDEKWKEREGWKWVEIIHNERRMNE